MSVSASFAKAVMHSSPNADRINPILLEHALHASYGADGSVTNGHQNHQVPTDCTKMTTPFTTRLAEYGYNPNEEEDEFVECYL